jgi:AraC family transcriptional regulator
VAHRSAIPFLEPVSGRSVDALEGIQLTATSEGLGWQDVHVEVGLNPRPWDVDNLTVGAHYLALNTDPHPLLFEAIIGGKARRVVLNPGEMWFCPAGETFTHHVPSPSGFALVTVTPAKVLHSVEVASEIELQRRYGVENPALAHLVRALGAEAERGGSSGAIFVDAIATALSAQLLTTFGVRTSAPPPRDAGLSKASLRRVLESIDASLETGLSVAEMAREVGLSTAHFARAFKSATGASPHQYVIQRRLNEARRALEGGDPDLLNVALRLGFSDQAHFTRLFKRAYGVPPGQFVRARRSRPKNGNS